MLKILQARLQQYINWEFPGIQPYLEKVEESLQYSCLENPRDGGAWWAAIYGVAQSRTQLKRLSSHSSQGFPGGSDGKHRPAMKETWVQSVGWKDTLEKGMATYSSILA